MMPKMTPTIDNITSASDDPVLGKVLTLPSSLLLSVASLVTVLSEASEPEPYFCLVGSVSSLVSAPG